ncbi:HDOD domain-containing protein [Shewanella sp. D64]|uniref:HDOD domain-containing protein n=1 Tax=unclassified Shewanella TaxID=196818 RepID=UPI0022BA2497|nr:MULTISPECIES: HDOD domain-containing protein [unclassified Shewanella]MEC4726614.1 HDOD domain-containing protein [Shewanella sp. D64]MEC4737345.1 HDOD domain-containing protein [Shewanella sp. E94]WBJ97168.1 HDOD domain-containing protein [Shewanella sp. MTB7]
MTQSTTHPKSNGIDYWIKRISDQEMPALCSTVKTLEKLAKDDVSSLGILGKSVMHDNALTSRILRVANSATYSKGHHQITTVSRATVMLGFDNIRSICITAKLLSSLLESEGLTPCVYQRLLKLMARAFQAAMLAKMMLRDHEEELQEEVFIASLLYHLGESAFWSTGSEQAIKLDVAMSKCSDAKEEKVIVREILGTSFNMLSQGIAKAWGLGEVLQKALNSPETRTPEIRSIFLANQICEILTQENPSASELQHRLQQAATTLEIEVDELKGRMIRCSMATKKLAEAYGAKVLLKYLPNPKMLTKNLEAEKDKPTERMPNMTEQLKSLRALTDCAVTKADFNQVITITLEGILSGVGVDRCGVLLLSPNRKRLQPRVVLGEGSEQMKNEFIIALEGNSCLFGESIELKQTMFIDDPSSAKWQGYMNDDLKSKVSATGFMISPLIVEQKVIGMIYADRASSARRLGQSEYDNFIHFSQLASLCLTAALGH